MYIRRRAPRWEHHMPLLIAMVIAAVLAYIPLDRGSIGADIPEIIIPIAISMGLVLAAIYLRTRRLTSEQLARIAKFGWIGALSAGVIAVWWITLHLFRELPIGSLGDQIVTIWSFGIGAGVLVGIYTVHRHEFDGRAERDRVLAETAWTGRSASEPILEAAVEAIAEVEGLEPREVDSLYSHVNPEAFTELRAHDSRWQLLFYTDEYEIRISSQGTVTIYEM